GFFLNTLVLRTDTSGDPSFRELLARVRRTDLDAYEHQAVPFERLVEALNPARSPARHPLFQVMLSFRNNARADLSLPSLTAEPVEAQLPAAKFDLSFSLTEGYGPAGEPDGVRGEVQYASALFDEETVRALAERLLLLLGQACDDPDRPLSALDVLLPGERERLLQEWNTTRRDRRTATLADLFEQAVRTTPDAVAVRADGTHLTYRELNARANRLAHLLIGLGCGPESVVALALPRSLDLIVAAHAVAKAGAAYTPVDPEDPAERIARVCEDAAVALAISTTGHRDRLPAALPALLLDDPDTASALADRPDTDPADRDRTAPLLPDHPAYVMFTSGSTGRPKGVVISQRSVVNHLGWLQDTYRLTPDDRVLQKTPIGFTVSVWELFWPLQTGACTVVAKPDGHRDPGYLTGMFTRHGITTVHFVPSMLEVLLAEADRSQLAGLRRIFVGGEGLTRDLYERFTAAFGVPLHYKYGSTEVTCDATVWDPDTDPGARPPVTIGVPVHNTRVYVLDTTLRPVPPGVPGELYVAGDQVARGYAGRPGLTAERFVADPFTPGERMYRTGDMVRWDRAGRLHFVGRSDHQLKVRGVRVEPAEIEAVLTEHPAVTRAAVVLRDETLVAYVTGDATPGELHRRLASRLPGHLVPRSVVVLPEFPLTTSGKVDRAALPAPEALPGRARVEPRTEAERRTAAVFGEVLGSEPPGAEDDFFQLGGDSILSIQVVARARQEGLSLTSRDVYRHQTVAALARCADAARGPREAAPAPEAATGPAPLTPIQHWLFDAAAERAGHYAQALSVRVPDDLDPAALEEALNDLVAHHDALRSRFVTDDSAPGVRWHIEERAPRLRLAHHTGPDTDTPHFGPFDLARGPLLRAVLHADGTGRPRVLHLAVHHLVVDGVSWRVLLEDLDRAYRARRAGDDGAAALPAKSSALREWARRLAAHAADGGFDDEREYWTRAVPATDPVVPATDPDGDDAQRSNTYAAQRAVTVRLSPEDTSALLRTLPDTYRTQANDVLLSALGRALCAWSGRDRVVVDVEGHGREELFPELDISRTVGWFTTRYPVALAVPEDAGWDTVLKRVKEQLRAVPRHGLGHDALRHLADPGAAPHTPEAQVSFNYLGRLGVPVKPEG
ncbi:amino acid adenylation domain-containing protein, partial [Streptomyces olivaceoviridis]